MSQTGNGNLGVSLIVVPDKPRPETFEIGVASSQGIEVMLVDNRGTTQGGGSSPIGCVLDCRCGTTREHFWWKYGRSKFNEQGDARSLSCADREESA